MFVDHISVDTLSLAVKLVRCPLKQCPLCEDDQRMWEGAEVSRKMCRIQSTRSPAAASLQREPSVFSVHWGCKDSKNKHTHKSSSCSDAPNLLFPLLKEHSYCFSLHRQDSTATKWGNLQNRGDLLMWEGREKARHPHPRPRHHIPAVHRGLLRSVSHPGRPGSWRHQSDLVKRLRQAGCFIGLKRHT